MQVVFKKINFDLETVVAQEIPYLSTFYRHKGELNQDIRDLLAFPVANKDAMPFYTIKEATTYKLNQQFEDYYKMMVAALEIAMKDRELMDKFFDCHFWREHGDRFLPYAKATFQRKHKALYGRYDACFEPRNEQLLGIYEFNGDTPVMLFESVNLQANLSDQLGTDQYNNWWEIFEHEFAGSHKNVAVACGTDYVEDMATCETVAQAFQSSRVDRNVSFLDLKELDYDHMNLSKPWIARDSFKPLDAIYILSPWEEMVDTFPKMLDHWEQWIDNVHLFEPAWRWFLAHKGMTALCTYLCEDPDFMLEHYEAYKILIPTYLTFEELQVENNPSWCVEKPVVGRLSNNIKIWNSVKELQSDTGGFYSDENTVFQVYTPPRKVEGRNNFILGMWMCGEHSASLCAREFDTEVLSISNERFIPHIVIPEGVDLEKRSV